MAMNDQLAYAWKSLSHQLRDNGPLEATDKEGKKYILVDESREAGNQAGQLITLVLTIPRIEEGGFALVYQGKQIEPGGKAEKDICLKQAKGDRTGPALANEIKHFNNLRAGEAHDNIIRMMFSCTVGIEEFIVLEFFEGKDLHQLISTEHKRNSPVRSLVHQYHISVILRQQARVIKYLQDRGIVHRDFTPANILYNRSSEFSKLIDFGLACFVNEAHKIDGYTAEYAAPEILLGEYCDQTVDVYGLGATLAHLVTLESPWHTLPKVYSALDLRKRMYRDYLERIGSGAAAVECMTKISLTEAIREELGRFKQIDGTSSDMVVQKELEQASEGFNEKLLRTIKCMMSFDRDDRGIISVLIEETEKVVQKLQKDINEGGVASAPIAPVHHTTAAGPPGTAYEGGSDTEEDIAKIEVPAKDKQLNTKLKCMLEYSRGKPATGNQF